MKYLSITCLVKQELEIQTCSFSTWLFQGVCRKGISSSVFHGFAVKSGKLYFNPALTLVPVLVWMKMKWNLGAVVLVLGTNKFWSDQWLLFRGSVFYRALIFMVKVNYSLKWPFTSQFFIYAMWTSDRAQALQHRMDGPCVLALIISCSVSSLEQFQCCREVWGEITKNTLVFPFHSHLVIWSLSELTVYQVMDWNQ